VKRRHGRGERRSLFQAEGTGHGRSCTRFRRAPCAYRPISSDGDFAICRSPRHPLRYADRRMFLKVTALLLAAVLAAPNCCCLGLLLGSRDDSTAPHSCCAKSEGRDLRSDGRDQEGPPEPAPGDHKCQCSAGRGWMPDRSKVCIPQHVVAARLPAAGGVAPEALRPRSDRLSRQAWADRHRPPGSASRAALCVFLI